MRRLPFLFLAFLFFFPAILFARELPKIALLNSTPDDITPAHPQAVTSVVGSEAAKLRKYEVYSQDNVRILAGWGAERMTFGCTDNKRLTVIDR